MKMEPQECRKVSSVEDGGGDHDGGEESNEAYG